MRTMHIPLVAFPKIWIGIFLVWLVHLTAIIGVSIGHESWFIEKTPGNLMLMLLLGIWFFPIRSSKATACALLFFCVGMLVEFLGVNYGLLFGSYFYGENLGPKVGGVPLLIGVNWALLVFATGLISNNILSRPMPRAILGAVLMVCLDYLMEHIAPRFSFWEFEGGIAPLSNYIGWFIVALVLQIVFQGSRITGNTRFAVNLFVAQVVFFGYFFLLFR